MKRSSIILASASAICLMAHALPLCAQHELECFINDPDKAGMTNIRATPGGKVLFQVDGQGGYDLTVIVQQGGWWRIKDPVEVFGDDMKDPKAEAWIHRSVLALATDCFDAHHRFLRTEPRADAPRAGMIPEFIGILRPLEMSADGEWVKVNYEAGKLTGWIRVSETCPEDIESGDGYGFPWMYAYANPDRDITLLSAPGGGAKTTTLKKGGNYQFWLANPVDGWWDVLGDSVDCGTDEIDLPDYSWVSSSSIFMRVIDPGKKGSVPVYGQADGKSRVIGHLKAGTEVHPLDITTDRPFWGEEPVMIRVVQDENPDLAGWVLYSDLSAAPAPFVTFDDVAGTYESEDERVVLTKDGALHWSVIGGSGQLDYSYIIRGYGIYQEVEEAGADARPDYIFDPVKKTLGIFDTVYSRK